MGHYVEVSARMRRIEPMNADEHLCDFYPLLFSSAKIG